MDDEIIVGLVLGLVGGTVAGMMIPEEKKPGWIKSAGIKVKSKWKKYDEHRLVLEDQRAEWVKAWKEKCKKKKEDKG